MDGRIPRPGVAFLALAFLALPLFAQRIEIVSGDAKTPFTYRELIQPRVAADPDRGIYHHKGCAAIRTHMQWLAPAAATLRKLTAHACPVSTSAEYAMHTRVRQPRDASATA